MGQTLGPSFGRCNGPGTNFDEFVNPADGPLWFLTVVRRITKRPSDLNLSVYLHTQVRANRLSTFVLRLISVVLKSFRAKGSSCLMST